MTSKLDQKISPESGSPQTVGASPTIRKSCTTTEGSHAPHLPRLVETALFGVVVSLFMLSVFPAALFNADTLDMYRQSQSGAYTTWHSLFMSLIFALTSHFWAGPAPLMLLTCFLTSSAIYYCLSFIFGRLTALLLSLCVVILLPPVFVLLGSATKDALAIGLLLWCISLNVDLLVNEQTGRKHMTCKLVVGAILAIFAVQVRVDLAPSILLSYVVLGLRLLPRILPTLATSLTVRAGAAVTLAVAIIAFAFGIRSFTVWALDARASYPLVYVLFFDIAGVSLSSNSYFFPETYKASGVDMKLLKTNYSPLASDLLLTTPETRSLNLNSPQRFSELADAWVSAVSAHPVSYLANRWNVLAEALDVGKRDPSWKYALTRSDGRVSEILGPYFSEAFLKQPAWIWDTYLRNVLLRGAANGVFDGYLYLVACVGVLLLRVSGSFGTKEGRKLAECCGGGIEYLASFVAVNMLIIFFLAPSALFRYLYPTVFCSLIMLALCVGALWGQLGQRTRQAIQ